MYIRIYWGRVAPDSWSTLEQKYRKIMTMKVDGLLKRYVTREKDDPENMFTITVWRDLESVQTWEASAEYRDLYLAAISPHIIGSRSVSLCEVLLDQSYATGDEIGNARI